MSATDETPKTSFKDDFFELIRGSKVIWLIYAATFFEYLGIFSFLSTLKFWLSKDHGMTDQRAGWWAATFSTLLTAFVFIVGPLSDSVGVRRMLILSFALAALTRLGMSLAHSQTTAIVALLCFGFAYATTSPVLQTAVQRAVTKNARAFAFSLWYVSFNLAGVLVGPIIDGLRAHFRDPVTHQLVHKPVALPLLGTHEMSAYQAILGAGFVFAVVASVLVLFIPREFGHLKDTAEPGAKKPNPLMVLKEVLVDKAFWRFMFLLVLLSLVKLIFQHMHFTWPSYVTRVNGETFPVGTVWSINSFLILGLAPLATALTRKMRSIDVLMVGAFLTAASPFVLCFGSSMYFQIAMIVVLTLGEALWSPRLYEYNLSIAPPGREATYVSLASLPYFFAKLIVGPTAGYLLAQFCPETGPRNPALLWGIIGAVTLVGPVSIFFTRNWISKKDAPPAAPAAA
ncbi:MAG: MFS transporter [Myxococcales bacterium]|nr:MFS transporter [Myxococcales bacterium]